MQFEDTSLTRQGRVKIPTSPSKIPVSPTANHPQSAISKRLAHSLPQCLTVPLMKLHPDHRIAGILAPLFALRTEHDMGIGDTAALVEFVDWAQAGGFKLVQLLPVNETGIDNSPYMAISAVALDPTTIHLSPRHIEDLTQAMIDSELAKIDVEALRRGPVQYRVVKPLKLTILRAAFKAFENGALETGTAHALDFRAFVEKETSWLEGYAFYRALMERNGGQEKWDEWPSEHQSPVTARAWLAGLDIPARASFERDMHFFQYVQWIAFRQWRELKTHCDKIGVALMGDVPFGVGSCSADVWAHRELFDLTWSGGAPPEPAFTSDAFVQKWGQNWGVPHYRWDRMKQDDLAWWRKRVGAVREMFHLFRVDHVLGFYRIFSFPWIPQRNDEFLPLTPEEALEKTGGRLPQFLNFPDDTEAHCRANCAHGAELLEKLAQEVGEFRLVAEDLGTVPPYVRPNLADLHIAGFKIPHWEKDPDGSYTRGQTYPALSVATYATHDHEPLRAMWDRWTETFARNERGEPGASGPAWEAGEEMRKLMRFAGVAENQPLYTDAAHEGLVRGLFQSASWIAVLMITDLFGSAQRFNVPGAIADSNWSERLAVPISQWDAHPDIGPKIARIRALIPETGRLGTA